MCAYFVTGAFDDETVLYDFDDCDDDDGFNSFGSDGFDVLHEFDGGGADFRCLCFFSRLLSTKF